MQRGAASRSHWQLHSRPNCRHRRAVLAVRYSRGMLKHAAREPWPPVQSRSLFGIVRSTVRVASEMSSAVLAPPSLPSPSTLLASHSRPTSSASGLSTCDACPTLMQALIG